MIERRNFYRILHVQPDAPTAVITESYRVLLQKLNSQVNLNGLDWNVSLLNIAYNTLRDPHKRATYDRELLKRYHIRVLSQGALGVNTDFEIERERSERPPEVNQRNYYRVMQVQPDAPVDTIKASYRALKRRAAIQDTELLNEAYRVLSNPAMRQRYDAIFAGSLFRAARKTARRNIDPAGIVPAEDHAASIDDRHYRPIITRYCPFCKTPNVPQTNLYQSENCLECSSPLLLLHQENPVTQRTTRRITASGKFMFYLFWPGKPCQGICQDLSPAGLRFMTHETLNSNDIIKIDAPSFQAVAEVTHQRREDKGFSIGTRFIAVKFDQQYGNFVAAQV
ncbi:MAG: DnaJ domain-containing protein [Betaproteobacteria bacterium]|nr:DnaJ domain-containing protein [Betaproteobacteria bacterium]